MTNAPKKKCNQKKCQHKGKLQTITNFYKNRKMKDGRASECKDCVKIRNRRTKSGEYENPMSLEQMKQWNIDNPVVRTTAATVTERVTNG
jgi:hypothetical protein